MYLKPRVLRVEPGHSHACPPRAMQPGIKFVIIHWSLAVISDSRLVVEKARFQPRWRGRFAATLCCNKAGSLGVCESFGNISANEFVSLGRQTVALQQEHTESLSQARRGGPDKRPSLASAQGFARGVFASQGSKLK